MTTRAELLCQRHDVVLIGPSGRPLRGRCHPPARPNEFRPATLLDFPADTSCALEEAAEDVRAALRLGQADGSLLAGLLGDVNSIRFDVNRGHLRAAAASARRATADVRAVANGAPDEVAERLAAVAE